MPHAGGALLTDQDDENAIQNCYMSLESPRTIDGMPTIIATAYLRSPEDRFDKQTPVFSSIWTTATDHCRFAKVLVSRRDRRYNAIVING